MRTAAVLTARPRRSARVSSLTATAGRPGSRPDRAIVIGASMAGLTIARALADRYARVTVLDRDRLPEAPVPRRGIPQGRHIHLLLAAGAEALEELFPGFLEDLFADGASDIGIDRARLCFNGYRLARRSSDTAAVGASRRMVEAHVLDRVEAHPRIDIHDGIEVSGIIPSPDLRRIIGVRTTSRAAAGGEKPRSGAAAEPTWDGDLVVDCTGRRSRMPRWLAALGYPQPPVDELPVDVRYVTRHYRLPAQALGGDRLIAIGPTPQGARGGVALAIEDERWIVTMYGLCGQRPPLDPDGFETFAAGLPISDLHDALREGHALDDPTGFRYPASRRRRYERLEDLPAGLLVAGDAVCSFNPIYGQGMTVAALQAVVLRQLLQDQDELPPRQWFAAIAPTIDAAWGVATGADLAIDCVPDRGSLSDRLANAYITRLHAAARTDPELTDRFFRVSGSIDPPTRLLRPGTIARVVARNLSGDRRSTPRGG